MKITSLTVQEKNKERCNLFIDGEFRSGISLETVMKKRLKVGDELSEETLFELLTEDERVSAVKKSVDYVSKTMKTKWQVKDYLVKKGFSEDSAWYAVDKLKEYGYVNDVAYAKAYIELHSKTQGEKLLTFKLMQKGIKKGDILEAYNCTATDGSENAISVAKKYMRNKEKTKENKLKTYKYLLSKGFSYEQADYAVSDILDQE